MAINSRSKRFSMMNFGEFEHHLFEADGTVDTDDKYSLLGMYNGIAKDPLVFVETVLTGGMLAAQHVRRKMHRGRR